MPLLTDRLSFLRPANGRVWLRGVLIAATVFICVYFVHSERVELEQTVINIRQSPWPWAVLGGFITGLYVLLSGAMYGAGFAATGGRVRLTDTAVLFLKRNLISVFLPAGGVTSLAFFNRSLVRQGISPTQQYVASAVYTLASFVSLGLLAVPVLVLLLARGTLTMSLAIAFLLLLAGVVGAINCILSWQRGGLTYRLLTRYAPGVSSRFEPVRQATVSARYVGWAVVISLGVEVGGIAHLWVALHAVGYPAGLGVAVFGYVVATLLYAVSPVMRGIGVVELSLTYVLVQYGATPALALSATLYYRFFEFWLPLLLGLGSFLIRKDNLLLRVFPALLVLLLGVVNCLSALTPAIGSRVALLAQFLPADAIRFSTYAVAGLGVCLLFLSLYLIRGLQNAWWLTVFLTVLSIIGHLTKAIDYEEALLGMVVLGVLLYTRSSYTLLSERTGFRRSVWYVAVAGAAILLYGCGGVWWFRAELAGQAGGLGQVGRLLTLQTDPLLLLANGLRFARSLQLAELLWLIAFAYLLIRPVIRKLPQATDNREKALALLIQYGASALDYFKVYTDKSFFFDQTETAFLALRRTKRYAVVLEGPVAATSDAYRNCLTEFEQRCRRDGLKSLYYRVDETDLPVYHRLGKKSVFIGQEGIISLDTFTIEGSERKSLRNSLRKLTTLGYTARVYHPPLKDGLIQKLQAVSDEWLHSLGKREAGFTQGVFSTSELRSQTLVTVENNEEKVVAFANLIPDYAPGEATYDLIRKTNDAPNGVLDLLLIALINQAKADHNQFLNLGMAPLSGIDKPKNVPEMGIKYAYEHLSLLAHFKGLRFFKDKYADRWLNKYLVYTDDLDLIQAPRVIAAVSHYSPSSSIVP